MRCRCVLARFHLVGPTFSLLLIPPLRITKKGYLSVTFFYYWSGQWDSDPRHQPWQPKKLSQRWLLWASYHVIFTDIGMFLHIIDIINFGIGFSIFQTFVHYIFDNQTQYCYVSLQIERVYLILSIFMQDFIWL